MIVHDQPRCAHGLLYAQFVFLLTGACFFAVATSMLARQRRASTQVATQSTGNHRVASGKKRRSDHKEKNKCRWDAVC